MDPVEFIGKTIAFILLVGLSILGAVYAGFVGTELWSWFVVPLGAPEIGIAHGLGLMSLAGYPMRGLATAIGEIKYKVNTDDEHGWLFKAYIQFIIGILVISLFWGFGAIYHWFM